jgi:hypothetical protein
VPGWSLDAEFKLTNALTRKGNKPKELKKERRSMMRVVFVIFVALAVLFAPVTSIAKKGPSDKAYEHASDKAKFKRDPGSFDKTGKKTDEEATEQEEEMSEEEKAEKKKKKGRRKKNKN